MTATSTRLAQLTQFTATNVNATQDMKAMEKHVFIKVKIYINKLNCSIILYSKNSLTSLDIGTNELPF